MFFVGTWLHVLVPLAPVVDHGDPAGALQGGGEAGAGGVAVSCCCLLLLLLLLLLPAAAVAVVPAAADVYVVLKSAVKNVFI